MGGITQQAEGVVSGSLGNTNGPCSVTGELPNPNVYQGLMLSLKVLVNNSQCKKDVVKVTLKLHRAMKCLGRTIKGDQKNWENE